MPERSRTSIRAPSSRIRRLELQETTIDGIKVDYIHTPQTAAVEQARVTGAVKAAKAASNAPDLLVKIARLRITKDTFGYVNKMASLPYRVFVTGADVTLTNLDE